jgi:hypothetical protein
LPKSPLSLGHYIEPDRVQTVSPTPISTIPVTFGPHEADWWMVVVTCLGAVASLAVAIVALQSARQAKRVADASKEQRDEERSHAYDLRMEEAIAGLLVGLSAAMKEIKHAASVGAKMPGVEAVLPAMQLVRLRANEEDSLVIQAIATDLSRLDALKAAAPLYDQTADLMIKIREWHNGECTSSGFIGWVAGRK